MIFLPSLGPASIEMITVASEKGRKIDLENLDELENLNIFQES